MISGKVKELLRIYFFIPLTTKVLSTQELQGNISIWLPESKFVNFLIRASFPDWKASACIISMPLLWENPPEWLEQGFTLINPQLDYFGTWCSNTRHVCSQISSWRVAAGWDSPGFFCFFFFFSAELKECSWSRKPKWLGLFITLIDTRCLEMSPLAVAVSVGVGPRQITVSLLSVFLVHEVDDL